MTRFIFRTALIAAAALLCFPAISQTGITNIQTGDGYYQRSEANYATYRYLRAMDGGNYASLWKSTSPLARNGLTESSWTTTVANMRKLFGLYKERTEEGYGFSSQMSNGEKGVFYAIVFKTQFSLLTAEEKIILSHEGGEWKIAGYFLKTYGAK